MAAQNETEPINTLAEKIDRGLEKYYNDFGRNDYKNEENIGKFMKEAEGFEDEDIKENLDATNVDDCLLIDFDDNFPGGASREEILRILKYISVNGSYPVRLVQNAQLDLKTLVINKDEVFSTVERYLNQMPCLMLEKDNAALSYFFAVSEICKYPFITYIVDSYTRDNAKQYHTTKQPLKVSEWTEQNKFFKELTKSYPKIAADLKSAVDTYCVRVMNRLTCATTIKIKDNLEEVCEYIAGVPWFIDNLLEKQLAVPPFQVDLSIAVNGVKSAFSDNKVEYDDDDDDDGYNSRHKP
eukprot:144459_1